MLEADAAHDYSTPTKRTNVYFDDLANDHAQTRAESYAQFHPPNSAWGFLTPDLSITDYSIMDYNSNSGSNYAWIDDAETSFTSNEHPERADGAIEEVCFGMVRPRGI
jgi:hypothetical protein